MTICSQKVRDLHQRLLETSLSLRALEEAKRQHSGEFSAHPKDPLILADPEHVQACER